MPVSLVLDLGSFESRVGFSPEKDPALLLPTVVEGRKIIQSGVVDSWDSLEAHLNRILDAELHLPTTDHPLLFCDSALHTSNNREKYAEILFSTFNVPAVSFIPSTTAILTSFGRTGGIGVDIGSQWTHSQAVAHGFGVTGDRRIACGGETITTQLLDLLPAAARPRANALAAARALKEQHAYAKAFDAAPTDAGSFKTRLPDGQEIEIQAGAELYQCTESACARISTGLVHSIAACDPSLRPLLASNVVIAGGTSSLRGLSARIAAQATKSQPHLPVHCEVGGPLDAWRGASVLASHSVFQRMLVTQQEVAEYGSRVLYRNPFETFQ